MPTRSNTKTKSATAGKSKSMIGSRALSSRKAPISRVSVKSAGRKLLSGARKAVRSVSRRASA